MNIGLLHPGQMGTSVAQALRRNQHQVFWLPEDRSQASAERAQQCGLVGAQSLTHLCDQVDAIISVCPPEFAESVAESVVAQSFTGIYLDANAISSITAQNVQALFGEHYVDGGIIGPPALQPGTTRLYLSGPLAEEVALWFGDSALEAIPLSGLQEQAPANAASLLKMAYAAYTKGVSALLLDVCALADAGNVSTALQHEWQLSQPQLTQAAERSASGTAAKAWRFVAEMREIEATFAALGLPSQFHAGAAEVYERMAHLQDVQNVDLAAVVQALKVAQT
ncbi:MAG: DUF1932 domain-containing protein [Pseudomonadales bacterium]